MTTNAVRSALRDNAIDNLAYDVIQVQALQCHAPALWEWNAPRGKAIAAHCLDLRMLVRVCFDAPLKADVYS